jgi:NAD(P)H-hydrate epimerase
MMKLLSKKQIKDWDIYSIVHNKISSFELMKVASNSFCHWFQTLFHDLQKELVVLCGSGNNGGDGLCVSRILRDQGYRVKTHLFLPNGKQSKDNKLAETYCDSATIHQNLSMPSVDENAIIIDGLVGSGLTGGLRPEYHDFITCLNNLPNTIISIDIPSGLDPDGESIGLAVEADYCLSFEIPKRAFFYHENARYVKSWSYRPIGLCPEFLERISSDYHYINRTTVMDKVQRRLSISSKVSFGFGQLCGGSDGMFGSVILASKSAMRCGLGRLAVTLPKKYEGHLIAAVPEVMTDGNSLEENEVVFEKINRNINVVAAGPGLGMSDKATSFIASLLLSKQENLVLDADALNIVSRQKWLDRIPENTIITPHEYEFERLFGESESHFSRVELQKKEAKRLSIYIVLKGHYTTIATPSGQCYFNATGNVGMATAGSGDVLTGMVMSFLGQGYNALDACLLGVYLHGVSGDQARLKYGEVSLIASDIIEFIPESLKNLYGR